MVKPKTVIYIAKRITEKTMNTIDREASAMRKSKEEEYRKRDTSIGKPYLDALIALEKKTKQELIRKVGKDKVSDISKYQRLYTDFIELSEKEQECLATFQRDAETKKGKILDLFNDFEMNVLSGIGDDALQTFIKELRKISN